MEFTARDISVAGPLKDLVRLVFSEFVGNAETIVGWVIWCMIACVQPSLVSNASLPGECSPNQGKALLAGKRETGKEFRQCLILLFCHRSPSWVKESVCNRSLTSPPGGVGSHRREGP